MEEPTHKIEKLEAKAPKKLPQKVFYVKGNPNS